MLGEIALRDSKIIAQRELIFAAPAPAGPERSELPRPLDSHDRGAVMVKLQNRGYWVLLPVALSVVVSQ